MPQPKHRIVDKMWFTSNNTVGIVVVDNGFEMKAYIGVGSGLNEEADALWIAQHGARVHKLALENILSWLEKPRKD